MEKGVRGFVSFVRGYQEHGCRFIFRVKELDLAALARAFGLLRIPRMPETKHLRTGPGRGGADGGFVMSAVDPDSVPYKDKAREKQRQQRLAQEREKAAQEEEAQDQRKQQAERPGKETQAPAHKLPAQKRRQAQQREDDDDLDDDWRMLKKLKAGKISEHDYNVACGISDNSDSGGGDPQPVPPRGHSQKKNGHRNGGAAPAQHRTGGKPRPGGGGKHSDRGRRR
jgi:ATP-dependent RNA helicase DDX55/SPB4